MATNLDELNAQSAYAPLPPIFAKLGLAYDDVLLLPNETDVIPSEVDTSTHLTRKIVMNGPGPLRCHGYRDRVRDGHRHGS